MRLQTGQDNLGERSFATGEATLDFELWDRASCPPLSAPAGGYRAGPRRAERSPLREPSLGIGSPWMKEGL